VRRAVSESDIYDVAVLSPKTGYIRRILKKIKPAAQALETTRAFGMAFAMEGTTFL